MPVIYVLHFDEPLAHAQHYAGCTTNLRKRLQTHAAGHGSHLTKELFRQGREWILGGLYETSRDNMRKHERCLKDQANAKRYCEICSPTTARIKGARAYSVSLIPFAIRSEAIREEAGSKINTGQTVQVYRSSGADTWETAWRLEEVKKLMTADKDALGFIPAGGEKGLKALVDRGQIILCEDRKQIVGYAAFTMNKETLNIHQCCVRDDYRLLGLGKQMERMIETNWPEHIIQAKVRDDLAANEFWQAIGFELADQWSHKTSRKPINFYRRAIQCLPTNGKTIEPTSLTTKE